MTCACDCSVGELYIGNTINVEVDGLTNAATDAYINDATVAFTVKTMGGDVFDSLSGESMAYVTASNGDYLGAIPSTTPFIEGRSYLVEITATKSGVGVGFWRFERKAKYRTGC